MNSLSTVTDRLDGGNGFVESQTEADLSLARCELHHAKEEIKALHRKMFMYRSAWEVVTEGNDSPTADDALYVIRMTEMTCFHCGDGAETGEELLPDDCDFPMYGAPPQPGEARIPAYYHASCRKDAENRANNASEQDHPFD